MNSIVWFVCLVVVIALCQATSETMIPAWGEKLYEFFFALLPIERGFSRPKTSLYGINGCVFRSKLNTSEKSRINPTKSGRPLSTIFVAEFETCSYGLVRVRKKVAHDRSWVLKLCNCGWFGLGFLVAPVSSFQTRAGKLGINRSCNNFVHPEASIVNQSW